MENNSDNYNFTEPDTDGPSYVTECKLCDFDEAVQNADISDEIETLKENPDMRNEADRLARLRWFACEQFPCYAGGIFYAAYDQATKTAISAFDSALTTIVNSNEIPKEFASEKDAIMRVCYQNDDDLFGSLA